MNLKQLTKRIQETADFWHDQLKHVDFWAALTQADMDELRKLASGSFQHRHAHRFETVGAGLVCVAGVLFAVYLACTAEPAVDASSILSVLGSAALCGVVGLFLGAITGSGAFDLLKVLTGDSERVLQRLRPLSECAGGCEQALSTLDSEAACAYRDRVVAAGRELTDLDGDILKTLKQQEANEAAAARHRENCQRLHGLMTVNEAQP